MNLLKHRNVKFRTSDNLSRVVNSVYYDRHELLLSESETQFFEVVSKKRTIKDSVPISTAFYILGNAKLTVLRFMNDLQKCIVNDAIRLLYMGLKYIFFLHSTFFKKVVTTLSFSHLKINVVTIVFEKTNNKNRLKRLTFSFQIPTV